MALIPKVDEGGHEYLVGVQLPFADDLRMFTLPSFEELPSQLQPTDTQLSVMDHLVSSANLGPSSQIISTRIFYAT